MLEKGDILQNRYRIIRQLGEGGMGAIYEAEDNQRFGKSVALKEILLNLTNKNSEHFRRAFEREAKILTQIDHEAVPKVIGYILETDCQILVMELIEGDDLDKILEREQKPFSLKNVLDWADQLLDALDYLHTLKLPIIHRDIKPQNLKLTSRGKIKLLDFGIAKDTDIEITLTNMPQKTFVGATLYYSPIEQIIRIPDYFEMLESIYPEKARKIVIQSADARSDIYALGATLYHLLTNVFPRPAHLRVLEVWAGRSDSLKPVNVLNPEIPTDISDCLQKSLGIEREDRFTTALEMQMALQQAISDEKQRREEQSRNLWFVEQTKIRRELEAERRKLDEERQKQEKRAAETERRKQEKNEYDTKIEKWQNENLLVSNSDKERSIADTMPLIIQPLIVDSPDEKTFDWTQTVEKKILIETISPPYSSKIEFDSEKPKSASETIENMKQQTASVVSAPTFSLKQHFWILPVAAIAVLIFGVTGLGMFFIFGNSATSSADKTGKNPDTILPTASPTVSLNIAPSISPSPSPAQNVSENDKTKPTTTPTVNKTPAQTQVKTTVKTPAIQKTQKPAKTPNLSDNCIYNGKC